PGGARHLRLCVADNDVDGIGLALRELLAHSLRRGRRHQNASRMALMTLRANSVARRSSAFWSEPKNALTSVTLAVFETSYSSRNCIAGFDQSTLLALTSLNSIFAVRT